MESATTAPGEVPAVGACDWQLLKKIGVAINAKDSVLTSQVIFIWERFYLEKKAKKSDLA